jgi:hypothetical protein
MQSVLITIKILSLIQHYVIKFVSDLLQVSSFSSCALVSSINKTDCYDITEILLKVALNTITLTQTCDSLYQSTLVPSKHWFLSVLKYGLNTYILLLRNWTCIITVSSNKWDFFFIISHVLQNLYFIEIKSISLFRMDIQKVI